MADRGTAWQHFIADSQWRDWHVAALDGDASSRRYLRLSRGQASVIVMITPVEARDTAARYVAIGRLLRDNGLCAPKVLAQNADDTIMVLEDLGPDHFGATLARHPQKEVPLYSQATDILLMLEQVALPADLQQLTPQLGRQMIGVITDYAPDTKCDQLGLALQQAMQDHCGDPTVLALRDFHAENLIWRADRSGSARVGLLDFQDAFVAPTGYDLMSLLRDARRDVAVKTTQAMMEHFLAHTSRPDVTVTGLSCLAVQRNLRILGIFARLASTGKPHYMALIPRVWGHIQGDLATPGLEHLAQAVQDLVPPPAALGQGA